jgi:hypothetical protein
MHFRSSFKIIQCALSRWTSLLRSIILSLLQVQEIFAKFQAAPFFQIVQGENGTRKYSRKKCDRQTAEKDVHTRIYKFNYVQ